MTVIFSAGRYRVRFADDPADIDAALSLRRRCFRADLKSDRDSFDGRSRHLLVEAKDGALVCTLRLLQIRSPDEIATSYAAQFYELGGLRGFPGRMVEIGRFCISPEASDPDILRAAWAGLASCVTAERIALLFGCASFAGVDPARYRHAFGLLRDRHLAPPSFRARTKAPQIVSFWHDVPENPDPRQAVRTLPPLLRSYLAMGGWVSDHAVVDHDLGTMHVFTALDIARIPPARVRALTLAAQPAAPLDLTPATD